MSSVQSVHNNGSVEHPKNMKGSKEGQMYEKLTLALVAKNGHDLSNDPNSQFCNFALSTDAEIGKDCKFNDIVFRYIDKDNTKNLIFVQIKYKQVDHQIDSKVLSTEIAKAKDGGSGGMARDFNLQKYFTSYLSIKEELKINESEEYRNGNLKYVVIYTNVGLNVDELEKNAFCLRKAPDDITKLFTLKKSPLNSQESNHFYQFSRISEDLYEILEKSSDLERLAMKLAKYAVWKNYRERKILGTDEPLLKYYANALAREVIEKSDKVKKPSNESQNLKNTPYCEAQFRHDFVDNDETGSKRELRDALFEAIRELDESKKSVSDDELKNCLKEVKFKVAPYFGKSKKNKISNLPSKWVAITDQDITDFLKSLVFIVNQPSVNELEAFFSTSARVSLLERTSLSQILDKIENAGPDLRKHIEKVLKIDQTRKYRNKWISGESIFNFFQEHKQQINSPLTAFPKTLIYESQVMQFGKFKKLEKMGTCLSRFLSNDAQILCIITSATLLTSIKIFQYLNSEKDCKIEDRISVNFENLRNKADRESIGNAFQTENNSLLIIECNCDINEFYVKEFYERLSTTVKQNSKKKVIFIMQDNEYAFLRERLLIDFQNEFQLIQENDFIDMKDFEPMEDPLKKEVIIFQGQQRKLSLAMLTEINCWHSYVQHLYQTKDEQNIIDIQSIVQILNSDEIEVGSKPLGTSSLEGAYTSLFEEINLKTLVNKLMSKEQDNNTGDIYIMSGINGSNEEEKIDKLLCYLNILGQRDLIKNQMGNIDSDCKIRIVDDDFSDEDFKRICCNHPEKRIFLVHVRHDRNESKFFLQEFYNPKFYIKRKFKNIVIAKSIKELLINESLSETFIFYSLNNLQELIELLEFDNKSEKEQFEKNCENGKVKFYNSETDAKKSLQGNSEENSIVHLLKLEEKRLIWCNSHGSISNLRKYVDHEKSEASSIEEENFIKQVEDRKVVIISDDAGMGKSSTLTKLYESKYQSESLIETHWVFRLNLKDHLQVIRDLELNNTDSDTLNVIKFLSKIDKKLYHNLGKNLLRVCLRDKENFMSKPLLFAVDGFDEVLEESDREKVISLLKFLKTETTAKLWITTRRHFQNILEEEFSTFAVQFYPMNEEDEEEYIRRYFQDRCYLILNEQTFSRIFVHSDKMQKNHNILLYTDKFLNKMKSVFTGNVPNFIGTPLQLCLMLEGSVSHFKDWAENSEAQNPSFDFLGTDVLEVYERFLDRKHDVYFKKMDIKENFRKRQDKFIFNEYYKDFAKSLVLKSKPNSTLEEFKDIILFAGIIKSDGTNPEFIDTTFRYYFAAKAFSQLISELPNSPEYLIKEILNKHDYRQIRTFINLELKNFSRIKSFQLTLEHYGRIFEKLFREEQSMLFNDEKTVLHLAVEEGNKFIVSFLLSSLKGYTDVLKKFLFHRTTCGNSALDEAVIQNDADVVRMLLDAAAGISEEALQEFLSFTNTLGHNIIDVAAKLSKNVEIIKELLDRAVNKLDLIMSKKKKDSSLNIAIQSANEEFAKFIFQYFKHDKNSVEQLLLFCDDRNYDALCCALFFENNMAEYLLCIAKEMEDDSETLKKILKHAETLGFAIET